AHQPGSEPIDIPETIPNPVVVPKPTPTPTEPAPKEPVRIPEKVPQSGVSTADSCTAGMPWTAEPRSSGRSLARGAKAYRSRRWGRRRHSILGTCFGYRPQG